MTNWQSPLGTTPKKSLRQRFVSVAAISGLLLSGLATFVAAPATAAEEEPTATSHNGLALTPPMGWNSWNQVRCYGLTEDLVKATADAMASNGMAEAGYEYIVIDDCWQGGRDADTNVLFSHPERFAGGMDAIGDYIHSKGLKYGIYGVPGTETCANEWDSYPIFGLGSLGFETLDAETFETWGVDYLKYDWCRADIVDGLKHKEAFTEMRDVLLELDRDIVYGISEYGDTQPWTWAAEVSNLWRTTHDIRPTWGSVMGIINEQASLHPYASPGAWNDPDMLQVGNGSLTPAENRSHFGMWSMLAAPLFLGTDLPNLDSGILEVITNPGVIAIDQDPLGAQASRVSNSGNAQVWARPLAGGDIAVALLNTGSTEQTISTNLDKVGGTGAYAVTSVWDDQGLFNTTGDISATVSSHDTVILRLTPGSDENLPSALDLTADATLGQGETAQVALTVSNDNATVAEGVTVTLSTVAGVTAPTDAIEFGDIPARGTKTVSVEIGVGVDVFGKIAIPARISTADGTNHPGAVALSVRLPKVAYASDLPWVTSSNGYGPVERDGANGENGLNDGPKITLGETVYDKGIGTNPSSSVVLDLNAQCEAFTAVIGIDESVKSAAAANGVTPRASFEVLVDGVSEYSFEFEQGRDAPQDVLVDVTNANKVELKTGLVGTSNNASWHAWANWADAQFVCDTDVHGPDVEISLDPVTDESTWATSEVLVSVVAVDAQSEVASIEVKVDGGDFVLYQEPFSVSGDGEHTVTARATDSAGNVSEEVVQTILIDATPPMLEIEIADIPESVSVKATDSTSGIDRIEYTIGAEAGEESFEGETTGIVSIPLDALTPGTYTLTLKASDIAGNASSKTQVLTVPVVDGEQQPPTIDLSETTVAAGSQLTVRVAGMQANETVQIWLHSEPVLLGSAVTNADGEAQATVTIPDETAVGAHTIRAVGTNSESEASAPLAVTAFVDGGTGPGDAEDNTGGDTENNTDNDSATDGPTTTEDDLAATGADFLAPLIAAMILLLVAGSAVIIQQRKRNVNHG